MSLSRHSFEIFSNTLKSPTLVQKPLQVICATNAPQLEPNTTSCDVGLTTGNSQVTTDASDSLRR